MTRFSIARGAVLAVIFAAAVATAPRSPQRAAAQDSASKPLDAAPVEWKLVGRAVAVVQTPRGPLAGFLIGRDALLTGGLAGVGPHELQVTFSDPLPPGAGTTAAAPGSSGGPAAGAWEATAITPVMFDAGAEVSVVHLAPKGAVMPGDVYGVLGARDRAPSAGERVHAIVVSADGQRRYASAPPLAEAPVGDVGQFTIRAGGGAPLCDETGCVIGVYLDGGPGNEVLMIPAVKRLMPAEGRAIASCAIAEQREIHGAGSGGAGLDASGGGGGGRGGLMGGGGGGGGGGGSSPRSDGGNAFNPSPAPNMSNRFVPDLPHIADDPVVPDPADPEPASAPTPFSPERGTPSRDHSSTTDPIPPSPPGGPGSNPPGGGGGGGDDPPPIPEPSSLALLGAGAVLLFRRRR